MFCIFFAIAYSLLWWCVIVFADKTVWQFAHSFIFTPAFHLGRVAGAVALRGFEIPLGSQQSQVVMLASQVFLSLAASYNGGDQDFRGIRFRSILIFYGTALTGNLSI